MRLTEEGLKEYAIGEQLTVGNETLVVVKDKGFGIACFQCHLYGNSKCCDLECRASERCDCTGVHFEEVKEGV